MSSVSIRPVLLVMAAVLGLAACDDDPTTPAPAEGELSIVIHAGDAPVADAIVFHNAPGGDLVGATRTDAVGSASVEVTRGDMVSARYFDPDTLYERITTVTSVRPGDALVLLPYRGSSAPPSHEVVVTGEVPGEWDRIALRSPCGNRTTTTWPLTYDLRDDCAPASGGLALLLESMLGFQKQAFAWVADVPLDPSGTTTVDMTSNWRTDWQELEVSVPLAPFEVSRFILETFAIRDGANYGLVDDFRWDEQPSSASVITRLPRGFPDMVYVTGAAVGSDVVGSSYFDEVLPVNELTPGAGERRRLPRIVAESMSWTVPGRPVFTWTVDAPGLEGDVILLELDWVVGEERWFWRVHLPPELRSYQMPELPTELAEVFPAACSVENEMTVKVRFVDASSVNGYEEVRRNALLSIAPRGSWGVPPHPEREESQYWTGVTYPTPYAISTRTR